MAHNHPPGIDKYKSRSQPLPRVRSVRPNTPPFHAPRNTPPDLTPERQPAHQRPLCVINRNRHLRLTREMIRYPRLRIEGVRVIRQQHRLFRRQRRQQLFMEADSPLKIRIADA